MIRQKVTGKDRLICIALTLCKHACKSVFDFKSRIDPRPFSLDRVPNDAYFFVSLEAYKKPTFGKKGQKGRNAFPTGAKIYFSKKSILGLGAL